jgi:hypothetical protein
MATLVLTAVGSAIGGPIGGAIGAALGQQVDAALFAPTARQGSRLKELAVQTSSYGTQIPGIFGAMRVAGTVIWSTDLIEKRAKSGGGKGRPATLNYSYRVSLAVALSSRPAMRIGRIWADGNLIRGVSGDLKVDAQMRFYGGQENQQPDPLLASAEAIGECPAHRGIAYVVFEDLQLAEFGNRIPSFSFEIFERDEPLPLQSLMTNISDGEITAHSAIEICGFAAAGASVREAISPILDVCPVEIVARNGQLFVRDVALSQNQPYSVVIAVDENTRALDRPKHILPPAAYIPGAISLRYYDAERDYQAGIQQSGFEGTGRSEMRLELPAVLSATAARKLVEAKDSEVRYAREHWTGSVTTLAKSFQPGDHITTPDGRKWQIADVEVALGTTAITAKAVPKYANRSDVAVASGRHVPSLDQPVGETRIIIVELPLATGSDPNNVALALFAAGTKAGWKRAAVSVKVDDQWTDIGITAPSAVISETLAPLASHKTFLVDEASALDIELLHQSMELPVRDSSPLAHDAPIFWIDGECVRAGRVVALGGKTYRLSRLVRGCFSSLLEAPAHPAKAKAVMLDPASAMPLSEPNFRVGQTVLVEAQGLGDAAPASDTITVEGLAIKPTSPVHGRASWNIDGSLNLEWKRRSRLDLGWMDGVEQVQIEDQESYQVALYANDILLREWLVTTSALHISAIEVAAVGIAGSAFPIFTIRQIGRFAQSDPLTFGIS